MQRFVLAVLLLAALWSALPAGSPFRSVFGLSGQDPTFGDVLPTGDPETDPIMIVGPPPR